MKIIFSLKGIVRHKKNVILKKQRPLISIYLLLFCFAIITSTNFVKAQYTGTKVNITAKGDPSTVYIGPTSLSAGSNPIDLSGGLNAVVLNINTSTNQIVITFSGGASLTTEFDLVFSGGNFGSLTSITFNSGSSTSSGKNDVVATKASSTTFRFSLPNNGGSATGTGTIVWDIVAAAAVTSTTWNGTTWSNSAPTSTVDAIIASSVTPGSFTCQNLTINSSYALTIGSGVTATVNGNITNSGNGISGTGTLTIAAASGLSGNAITIGGTLNLSSGTFTTNSLLKIAPGGAIIGTYANLSGSVTLQQSIIPQRGWRIFANPFSTSQTFSTIASNNSISIQTTGSSNAAHIADNRTFSNTTNTWSDGGTSVAANTPYGLFIRGLASEVTGLTYTGGPTAFTYSVSGTLNGATTSVTPTSTSNFLLVGNPYAAPVNSKALTGQTAGTNYYVYTISQGGSQSAQRTNAGSWVAASSSSNTSNTIPVLGVIAYQPASLSSFSITPSDINTSGTLQAGLFGVQPIQEQIELWVEQNGDFRDKLFVRLDANATASGTERADLLKFYNDNVNVYTIGTTDDTRMAIDARNVLSTIPLGVYGLPGDYNFKLNNNNLPDGTTVYLNDKLLNTQTELKVGDTYNYTITSDASTYGEQRFELSFNAKKTILNNDPSAGSLTANVLGNITNGNLVAVEISGSSGPVSIAIKDMSGRAIGAVNATNGIQYINIGNTVSGMLLLQISDGKSSIIKKVMKL